MPPTTAAPRSSRRPAGPARPVRPDLRHRGDIDGLRAVAVVAVVLFHAELSWLQGGYVGVDVFFVLSGYLITQRIVAAHEGDGFRWPDFWRRRVRRLLPAGLATVAATLLAGLVLLPAARWADLGLSALAAATSWSNVLFAGTTGYWDAAALERPLLHTWSLGVEEQFYLLWPLLLAVALRRRRPLALLLVVGAVAGVASLVATELAPTLAFYLTPFRIHEFVVGGALVWADRHAWPDTPRVAALRVLLVVGGLAAIVWSCVAYGPQTAFPGVAVAAPVLGTAAVVAAREPGRVGRLLAARPLQAIGRGSYSLYLVHWPVLVLVAHVAGVLDAPALAVAAVLTVALTFAQYRLVEQRYRQPSSSRARAPSDAARSDSGRSHAGRSDTERPRSAPVGLVGVAVGVVVLAGAGVAVAGPHVAAARFGAPPAVAAGEEDADGPRAAAGHDAGDATGDDAVGAGQPPLRTPAEAVLRDLDAVNDDRVRRVAQRCAEAEADGICGTPADDGGRSVLVVGDSQAPDGLNAWAAANPDDALLVASSPGCPPLRQLDGVEHQDQDCAQHNALRLGALERMAPELDAVVVSMRLREDRLAPLEDLLAWLGDDLGLQVHVLGVGHEFTSRADELVQERGAERLHEPADDAWLVPDRPELDAAFAAVVEDAGATYLPRLALFCPQGACAVLVPDGSAMVVHDFTHLTLEAAELLGREQDVGR